MTTSARHSTATVPLSLCVWLPSDDGSHDEQRKTLTWDLLVSELPLLLDPHGASPLHKRLISSVEKSLPGRKVERIYWYGDDMGERTLHPSTGAELTRNLFDVLQQALARPRSTEVGGSGGTSDIHVLMRPGPPPGPVSPPASAGALSLSTKGNAAASKGSAAGGKGGAGGGMPPTSPGAGKPPMSSGRGGARPTQPSSVSFSSGAGVASSAGGGGAPPSSEEAAWKSAALRTQLRAAEAALPAALTEAVPEIEFSTPMLRRLLGQGSEAVLPEDDGAPLSRVQVAAVLLLWARRCMHRQQTRYRLTEQFRRVSKTFRRLKQMMAGRPFTAASAKLDDATLSYLLASGTPDLPPLAAATSAGGFVRDDRFKLVGRARVLPLIWRKAPATPRLFDAAFAARAWGGTPWALPGTCGIPGDAEYEIPRSTALTQTAIVKAVLQQNAKLAQAYRPKPGEEDDGTLPRFGPPRHPRMPSLGAARGTGARNSAEVRTGLHLRANGPDGLKFAEELRNQLRGIVLAMRADGEDGSGGDVELGECDLFEGVRWSAARAIGEPLQLAWGLVIAERLHFLWTKLGLGPDGKASTASKFDTAGRHGLPDLPHEWCPPRPRAPARRPGRADAREFLGLMLQQKRIHMNEVRSGYAHCSLTPKEAEADNGKEVRECLLYRHAMFVLLSLKRGAEAHARWVTLLQSQLADEAEDAVDAPAVAQRLRVAAGKISNLEELLTEGLAEYSDARGALRLHVFNAYQTVPLQEQLSSRLSATPLGDLLNQRFEQLELPNFSPKQLGCEGVPPFTKAFAPSKVQMALLPFVIPASEAAAPMSLDNALLNSWLGLLPALLRTAAPVRMKGVNAVGDVEAYDKALDLLLRSTLGLKPAAAPDDEPAPDPESTPSVVVPPGAPGTSFEPSTQSMLCLCAVARFAWAALRKGPDSQNKKVENERLEKAAGADGKFLTKKQLKQVDGTLQIIIDRVRAATPKGAKPSDKATIEALRAESTALENDTNAIGLPTPDDVDAIRDATSSLLDLIGAAARAVTQKRPPAEGPEFAAKNIARSVRIMRDSLAEALSMSSDIQVASKLDAEGLLAVVAEAVGDVAVELSDLIRAVFKCLYKSTLDSIIGSPKIPKGPARVFLQKLVVRKPNVPVPRLNAMEFVAGKSRAMAIALREAARDPALQGSEKMAAKAAASFASEVKGGEIEKAVVWATKVAEAIQQSTEGEQTMLKLITEMTLDDVRAVQGELSSPPPGGKKYLLSDIVHNGIGGVAKQAMLRKLELATVYDSDTPIELNLAFRLLPGRGDNSEPHKYALPLKYAEGEELRSGSSGVANQSINSLLDAGQRLRPDGSEFNVVRLHRIWCMQSAAADFSALLTLEKMMDEHVTLTLRSCFFSKTAEDEIVIRGKQEVMRYLTNDGFSTLGTTGTPEAPKAKGEGCTFVQPCSITADGDTRVVFGAGFKEACGSAKDRFRLGEQIKWGPWGVALAITRVADPLATHYEMVYRHHAGNFAAVKKSLDKGVIYYCLVHQRAPAHPQVPPFLAKAYLGQNAVFERLDNEMSRMGGKVAVISPALMGDKLLDLQKRRALAAEEEDVEEFGDEDGDEGALQSKAVARQAYAACVNWDSGAPGDAGPDVSVCSFAGRWLPPGEGPKRRGELVITVRETIGWKYGSKPPAKGDAKPSASRAVGLLVREFFVDTALYEAPPLTPGLAAAWALHEQRAGRGS